MSKKASDFIPAVLALADGSFFSGFSKGHGDSGHFCVGEVVFNTAMTGYQEIITDPSYHSQIINFTYPHIGNVGVNPLDFESQKIFSKGVVARKIGGQYSNWRATVSLPEFFKQQQVMAVDGVDTRALTHHLRHKGVLAGCIMVVDSTKDTESQHEQALSHARDFTGLKDAALAKEASHQLPAEWQTGAWDIKSDSYVDSNATDSDSNTDSAQNKIHVVVLDCGCKENILRLLHQRGCRVSVAGYGIALSDLLNLKPDAVMVSNGPGDPAPCDEAVGLVQELLARQIPLFGLCLGHQIIALALGAQVEKMKFGHHGANHPVLAQDGTVIITSQNHGFYVAAGSLPPNATVTHTSLFDGSLQGFSCDTPPVMTFQGHPEASPGPHDAAVLFDCFIQLIKNKRSENHHA